MIQASNELILGIELNEEYAQLTYFHPSVKEPLTLSFEPDAENYLLPVAMRKAAGGKWELWDGTGEAAAKVTDLYRKLQTEDEIETGAERVSAEELLADYFGACIGRAYGQCTAAGDGHGADADGTVERSDCPGTGAQRA